jgi:nanoRNase/pAp phosphatase (c-di-AMP/oligoRNAs hydrolase)
MQELSRLASELGNGRKLAVFHPNADCDAVGSAIAIQRNFGGLDLAAPGGISRLGKRLLEFTGHQAAEKPDYSQYDTIVLIDTSNMASTGVDPEAIASHRKLIIDHHMKNLQLEGIDIYYSDESKPSCAEIVCELLQAAGKKADRQTAAALAAGIITDTAHFRFARTSTLRALTDLLDESGHQLEEVLTLIEDEVPDKSRKLAFLKGAQRLRFEQAGEFTVAVSNVSSFEGALCKAMMVLGADVSFVGAQAKHEFRVSGRASQALVRKGFHVGKLMEETGRDMGGQGGGHAGAAGMSGTGEMEAALNILMEKALAVLRQMPKNGK